MTKTALFLTGHILRSKRKAGFHFLAESLVAQGWRVIFVTVGISWLSWLPWFKNDHRATKESIAKANRLIWHNQNLGEMIWIKPFHPCNLRSAIANELVTPLYALYGRLSLGELQDVLPEVDVAVIENGPGLLLVDRLKRECPSMTTIYNVSDDLEVLKAHPILLRAERRLAPVFDRIRVNSPMLKHKFARQDVMFIPQGINKAAFDKDFDNPYRGNRTKVVTVGKMLFDRSFFEIACAAFPEWEFHIIGGIQPFLTASNAVFHGELPFDETVPYLKWADIGVAPYRYKEGAEYLAWSSLKLSQYRYCGLPTVAPAFVTNLREGLIGYIPGDEASIKHALLEAADADRSRIQRADVLGWDDVARQVVAGIKREEMPDIGIEANA